MVELDETFGIHDLANEAKDVIDEILYNKTRISSYPGEMVITRDKVYFFLDPIDPDDRHSLDLFSKNPKSWCIGINEIASHGRYGLAGYKFTLNDGQVIRFTNVFRKKRAEIVEILEDRMK